MEWMWSTPLLFSWIVASIRWFSVVNAFVSTLLSSIWINFPPSLIVHWCLRTGRYSTNGYWLTMKNVAPPVFPLQTLIVKASGDDTEKLKVLSPFFTRQLWLNLWNVWIIFVLPSNPRELYLEKPSRRFGWRRGKPVWIVSNLKNKDPVQTAPNLTSLLILTETFKPLLTRQQFTQVTALIIEEFDRNWQHR